MSAREDRGAEGMEEMVEREKAEEEAAALVEEGEDEEEEDVVVEVQEEEEEEGEPRRVAEVGGGRVGMFSMCMRFGSDDFGTKKT